MTGVPQLCEAGWFVTGSDRDPVRHLFVRIEEHMDGTGVWTVELRECWGRRGETGKAMHRYPCESQAREALDLVYQLSCHLAPLPIRDGQRVYADTRDHIVIIDGPR